MSDSSLPRPFLSPKGNYRKLIVYQKAECIYDITYYFANSHLQKSDRTIDQMIQAARSGKQNIAEGSAASATSSETEIKLINVAKASLQELLIDYEDYLRTRGLERWPEDSPKAIKTRQVCARNNHTQYYMQALPTRTDETIANIAIILILQTDYLLHKLLVRLQQDFVSQGGIREQMSRARLDYKNKK